ncbi:MAG: glucose 1-dehydrogenase [Gammaproteobacteria bacterium]|nr:MAG: glucose 1-dehydrogenase [Gammaproteobacteria bacterium]
MTETTLPPQHQNRQPGIESEMYPLPESLGGNYHSCRKLEDKVAIITGGDSGIGRAVAFCYALEGADVVIAYLDETEDAVATKKMVNHIGKECVCLAGDVGDIHFCQRIIDETMSHFGRLDILVNNAGEQHVQSDFENITVEQLERTFRTNIFAYFYLAKLALPHMKPGSSIINTSSVTAYVGNPRLIDYSSTKGAIISFTRSLARHLAQRGIRVNAVAPGPIWTPLIPSTFPAEDVQTFGGDVPLQRPGQPREVAPCYVYLASDDASYITGQVLHPNGGTIING